MGMLWRLRRQSIPPPLKQTHVIPSEAHGVCEVEESPCDNGKKLKA